MVLFNITRNILLTVTIRCRQLVVVGGKMSGKVGGLRTIDYTSGGFTSSGVGFHDGDAMARRTTENILPTKQAGCRTTEAAVHLTY